MNSLVAIPVYNEQQHVVRILDTVCRHVREILVVDDGSTDETPRLLARRPAIHHVRHPRNLGYGRSLITALAWAADHGFDWLITLDCDGQHDPDEIPAFLQAISTNRIDVVSGSRYLHPRPDDDPAPPQRRRINHTLTLLLNQLLGLNLTDAFCGYKALRVKAVHPLELDEPGYAFPLQFWVRAAQAGLRVREIPVRRIYHDAERRFGNGLDDPGVRMRHYMDVLWRELARASETHVGQALMNRCRCA